MVAVPAHSKTPSISRHPGAKTPSWAVVIGASTGGPTLLLEVLSQLPRDLNASIFVVQHMPAELHGMLVRRLYQVCSMPVIEAAAGQVVAPGSCYIATGNRHLTLRQKASGEIVICTPAYPQRRFMPSIDVTMQSVASIYREHTIGVIMTGMGDDGAEGMRHIVQAGGRTLVESEETAAVAEMPRAVAERGGAHLVVSAHELAACIQRALSAK